MATGVFVTRQPSDRKGGTPEGRCVLGGLRIDFAQYPVGNANIGNKSGSAVKSAWQKHMPQLLAKEGDGLGSSYGHAHDRPGRAVDAARQIDRDHPRGLSIHAFNHRPRPTLDRPIEASTE